MKSPVIVALDFRNKEETMEFLQPFQNEPLSVKVGMELFYREGASIVYSLKEQGHDIFLDLKLHDIPTTVRKAMRNLADLGVDMVNVHAAGGRQMMEAALEGLEAGTPLGKERPLCIGVTQLTSTSQTVLNSEILIRGSIGDVVTSYAQLAQASGLDGVVSSTLEVPFIRRACGSSFVTVTPGIRTAKDSLNDQVRVATPEMARELGSSYIVVGRSITGSAQPLETYQTILDAWSGVKK